MKEKLKQSKENEEKFKKQLKEKEKQIQDLQNKLENIALTAVSKPTHIQNNRINNQINNLLPITDKHLKEQSEFLTMQHIKEGPSGYAKYAIEYPLKDRIICTDFSRRKIKYKDENGNLVIDPDMIKLSQKLFKAIEEQNDLLINEYIDELHEKYNVSTLEMDDIDPDIYLNRVELATKEISKLKDVKREIKEIANGNKNDTYYGFIKDLCSKTTN